LNKASSSSITMASGGGNQADNWRKNYEFGLYLDVFDDPQMLPQCHHTFCLQCLQELSAHEMGDFPCPQCRKTVTVPREGVASFQRNFYFSSEDLAKARAADVKVCEQYGPRHDKEYICVDCCAAIDSTCLVESHRTHFVVEVVETVDDAKRELKQAKVCTCFGDTFIGF
jgi:hypothetical protein